MAPPPFTFRADIEGLRAIAVLLVIAGHYVIPGFGAGFIGVDIFFVISGYLISGILIREVETAGRIRLLHFYANRLRRLLPALATVVIVSSLAAYHLLPQSQHPAQSEAGAAAILWISNIYFAFSDVDYFSAETSHNIFLHTWSLGVEEQFYLFWPLLIALALGQRTKNRLLPAILSGLTLVSFAWCIWLAQSQPMLSFYMMPTRAWQFALGGLAWLLSRKYPLTQTPAHRMGIAGLTMLLAGMLFITPHTTYPGLSALLPTFSVFALLWSGATSETRIHRLLSLPPLQYTGRLSYALYLWHWPILLLGEHLIPVRGNITGTLLTLMATVLAAFLTHHLIENPIRYGKAKQWPPRWQIGLAASIMILVSSQLVRWHAGTQEELANNSANDIYAQAVSDIPVIYSHGCDDWYNNDALKPCSYGKPDAEKIAVLLGDSIGAQWFPTLTAMLDPEEWRIVVLTKSSYPMVDEPYFYQRIGREYSECATWRKKAIDWIRNQNIEIVFLGSTASAQFTDHQWQEGTRKILNQLAVGEANIYLIESNPTLGFHGPDCLRKYQVTDSSKCTKGLTNDSRYHHVAALLKNVVGKYPRAHWIETSSFVCPDGICQASRDGTIIFRDSQHLTASFVSQAASHFLRQMQNDM